MIGELYDSNNVVVGQAAVFTAVEATPLPDLDTFNLADPFDPAFFVTPWTPVGATEQGWQLGADKSTQTINIEEQSTPVGTTLQSQTISVQGNLSEDITKTLVLAMNAVATATAAATASPGFDTIKLSDVPLYYAVALVTTNAEGFGRIVYAPKWTSLGNVSTTFRRAAGQRLYGVNFSTVCNTDDIEIVNFTAVPTGP